MKERHLRLVNSQCQAVGKPCIYIKFLECIKDFLDKFFISKQEKIYIIKDILIDLYKEYEITTGNRCTPYYVKAEKRIIKIKKERKIDHYYKLFKKYKSLDFE